MRGRIFRRMWLLGVPVAVAVGVAAVAIGFARPWDNASSRQDELTVEQATLRPGKIVLVVVNGSGEVARVAQVILNDAFVDFRQSQPELEPGDAERVTVAYPWVRGEAYEIRLMTSTGATVEYEIEEAS